MFFSGSLGFTFTEQVSYYLWSSEDEEFLPLGLFCDTFSWSLSLDPSFNFFPSHFELPGFLFASSFAFSPKLPRICDVHRDSPCALHLVLSYERWFALAMNASTCKHLPCSAGHGHYSCWLLFFLVRVGSPKGRMPIPDSGKPCSQGYCL